MLFFTITDAPFKKAKFFVMANVIGLTIKETITLSVNKLVAIHDGSMAFETLKAQLTYKNPKYVENAKWGYSNWKTPKFIFTYELKGRKMIIYRGALQKVIKHLKKFKITCKIIDLTVSTRPMDFEQSNTILRKDQKAFLTELLPHTNGLAIAFTSFGKSVTCLELIRRLKQRAIVMVHTTFLQEQWINEATDPKLFNINRSDIGGVGGIFKKRKLGKLNVCLYHSLSKPHHLEFFKPLVGCLLIDECLHPLSLVATPDGHKPLSEIQIGDSILNPDGKKITVTNKWVSSKKMYKYTFKGGSYLIASKEHKVKGFNFRWPKVREYKHGEFETKAISEQTNICVFQAKLDRRSNNKEQFLGWFLADGIRKGNKVCFGFTRPQKINRMRQLLISLKYTYKESIDSAGVTNFYIHIDDNILNSNEFKFGKDETKTIPQEYYKKCSVGVLMGLFDGDGTFTNTYAEYDTCSSILHEQILSMLRSLGIHAHSHINPKKNEKHSTNFRIIISGGELKRFAELIGFRVSHKKEKLINYLPKIRFDKPTRDIKKVEYVGVGQLIDITVDSDDHLFIANGCVVSNCQKGPIEAIQKVINHFPARHIYGVSAEEKRKDGMEFLTYDAVGPVRVEVEEKESASKILSKIKFIKTGYYDPLYDEDKQDYTGMITRAAVNRDRNIFICKRALRLVRQGRLVIIFVERKPQAMILAKYLSKLRVDLLLGATNWKDYSVPHIEAKYEKMKLEIPESRLLSARSLSPRMLQMLKDYDHETAYKRIEHLASRKKLDIIIGTKKAEVGLNIRPLSGGILTIPAGNNEERIKQIKGRLERKYKQEDIDYFGHEKEQPIFEVLVDDLGISYNAMANIADLYPDAIIRKSKPKTKRRTR